MTTKIELLPLPEGEASSFGSYNVHDDEAMIEYARANIARAVAPLQAEIEALREALAALKAENEMLREVLKDTDNELDWLDEDMDTCDHSYWNVRRNMKAALSKGDK